MSDLSELFARDPLKLTKPDISEVVAAMRQHQANFELGIKAVVGERKTKGSSKGADLLKELGLGGESPSSPSDLLKILGLGDSK